MRIIKYENSARARLFWVKKSPTLGKVGHIKTKLVYGESDHHHIIPMQYDLIDILW